MRASGGHRSRNMHFSPAFSVHPWVRGSEHHIGHYGLKVLFFFVHSYFMCLCIGVCFVCWSVYVPLLIFGMLTCGSFLGTFLRFAILQSFFPWDLHLNTGGDGNPSFTPLYAGFWELSSLFLLSLS